MFSFVNFQILGFWFSTFEYFRILNISRASILITNFTDSCFHGRLLIQEEVAINTWHSSSHGSFPLIEIFAGLTPLWPTLSAFLLFCPSWFELLDFMIWPLSSVPFQLRFDERWSDWWGFWSISCWWWCWWPFMIWTVRRKRVTFLRAQNLADKFP